jgi:hypothetical protein
MLSVVRHGPHLSALPDPVYGLLHNDYVERPQPAIVSSTATAPMTLHKTTVDVVAMLYH